MAVIKASGPGRYVITPEIATLKQLVTPTWDGNLISKSARDKLIRGDLVTRVHGWNFLTPRGVEICIALGLLRS